MIIYKSEINWQKEINVLLDFDGFKLEENGIIEVKKCHVSGIITSQKDEMNLNIDIDSILILASTLSLKPVNYNLKFNLNLIYSNKQNADFALVNKIDLREVVFAHVLLEKPMVIYADGEK